MATFKTSECDHSSRLRGKAKTNVSKRFQKKVWGAIKYLRDIIQMYLKSLDDKS